MSELEVRKALLENNQQAVVDCYLRCPGTDYVVIVANCQDSMGAMFVEAFDPSGATTAAAAELSAKGEKPTMVTALKRETFREVFAEQPDFARIFVEPAQMGTFHVLAVDAGGCITARVIPPEIPTVAKA